MESRRTCGNVETSRRYMDALNRGDIEGMIALMTPDVDYRPLRGGSRLGYRGPDGVRAYFAEVRGRLGRPQPSTVVINRIDELENGRRTVVYGLAIDAGMQFVTLQEFDEQGRIARSHTYLGSDDALLRRIGRI